MLFNTLEFALFLTCALTVYYVLSHRAQNVFLIVASYFFYSWWDWRFCGLLAFITLLNYFCALKVAPRFRYRKAFLYGGILGSLGALGFFKYYNFFIDSLATVFTYFGFSPPLLTLSIILPVGISFYTFQAMTYPIDVYREKIEASNDFFSVMAFMTFFPQLLSGPIERAGRMIPQFQNKRTVDRQKFSQGLLLIFIGLFKKIAIADALASTTNSVFSNAANTPWPELMGNLWLFTVQIYCDFSGYTDIARGIAYLFGFTLVINFNQPFFVTSITEHWRQWHISLSSWFREYLYIPLGGNRKGPLRTYQNIVLTMMLCGLWHGASWTYIFWGTLHGLYLAVDRIIQHTKKRPVLERLPGIKTKIIKFFSGLFTVHLIFLSWPFFCAKNISDSFSYFKGMLLLQGNFFHHEFYLCKVAFFVSLVLMIDIPQYVSGSHTAMLKWPWPLQGLMYGIMIILMILLASQNEIPFIYFQF